MDDEDRSKTAIVQSCIDVKSWAAELPSVEAVRPGRCPRCGAASRPPGRGLGLWGHGLKERQQRGPMAPGSQPLTVVMRVRRYLCRSCAAVVIVVPQGVIARRLFSGPAIGMAVALFGFGTSAIEVRRQVSPWATVGATAAAGWASLRRWGRDLHAGRLFPRLRRPAQGAPRQVAEWAGAALAAFAPAAFSKRPLCEQAFFGAAQMA